MSFGKHEPPKPGPGVQEQRSDATIEAHASGHYPDVGIERFAESGDLVDKGDLGRQEAVRGVFDELGALNIGDHEGNVFRLQRSIDLQHDVNRPRVAAADDYPIGVQEVIDRRAFAQELGVRDHGKFLSTAPRCR